MSVHYTEETTCSHFRSKWQVRVELSPEYLRGKCCSVVENFLMKRIWFAATLRPPVIGLWILSMYVPDDWIFAFKTKNLFDILNDMYPVKWVREDIKHSCENALTMNRCDGFAVNVCSLNLYCTTIYLNSTMRMLLWFCILVSHNRILTEEAVLLSYTNAICFHFNLWNTLSLLHWEM